MEQRRTKYTETPLSGLGKVSRSQLAAVLRQSPGTITPALVEQTLDIPRSKAAKLLARWAEQGWLQRIRRGIYIAVPLESERADSPPEDAWVIAEAAFSPCYITGWSAAEHWGLTEQIFRTVLVSTTRRVRDREPTMSGITFRIRTVGTNALFGLKSVWRGRTRVQVSDPSRTIIDLLADSSLGGGFRTSVDMFETYLASKDYRDISLLVTYAETLGVGAVFKRLGFLLSKYAPEEQSAIQRCADSLSAGNAKLDPSLPAAKLVTVWRLWLPEGWSAS
ncbi:MAG: type IV toxin-antitoxin system AbiEi family antitoxin domain-containing protein [Pseudohongiellaceae bacterium]